MFAAYATREHPRAAARSLLLWSGILLLVSASGYGAFKVSEQMGIVRLGNTMLARFDVYAASLEAELSKYEYLPDIAELNEDVVALLRSPTNPQLRDTVNRYLQQVNALARTSAFYVLDPGGLTLASSNFDQPDSFVGMDLSFRPYFRAAREGKPGRFYGIGTTSGAPGYYFANAIRRDGVVLGVAALKVSLDKLEKAWTPGSDIVLVADADGVIFLSSVPGWKFRTLAPLPPQTMQRLTSTRQYEKQSLEPLDLTPQKQLDHGGRVLSVATGLSGTPADAPGTWLEQTRTLATTQWKLIILANLTPIRATAGGVALIVSFAMLSLLLLLLNLQQRRAAIAQKLAARESLQRAHDDLERVVSARTADLREANVQLQREVAERQRAELVLRAAQDELVQTGKMAALGQLSAGITHELNQPLAAIRTLSDNAAVFAQRGRTAEVASNLSLISQLVDRMGRITGQLKGFARKSATAAKPVRVSQAIANALFIVDQRVRKEHVYVRVNVPDDGLQALCDDNRLEQVLINLYVNALDAMVDSPNKVLEIKAAAIDERVTIRVRDHGPGISGDAMPNLFTPFFTTKPAGVGLGLGLAISAGIVRDFGGALKVANIPGAGAEFVVELKRAVTEPADA